MRTLQQAIVDWFLGSPSWPFDIDVDREADDFMRDGCQWTRNEVREAIANFKESLGSVPSGAGNQSEQD